MRLNVIHVSRYAPVVPSLWVDTSEAKPVLKAYVNGRYQTLSEEIPAGILTEDMIVNSLDSDAVDMPLSAAQGKILKSLLDEKQGALTPGTGIEITDDNTINVTLDTTVFKVVPSLPDSPASGDENKIHLVPSENTGESNSYKEYLWVNNKWEEIGTYMSIVDLTPYLTKENAEKTYQKITDSSLQTQDKTVVGGINEVSTGLKEVAKPYVINLTNLLSAQDSESISTAIGGIDNLNGTVKINQVIFGILANGTVAVGIRVLGNQTTLTYFVDSVLGLTVNEIIITNTSGTLTKTANTHAVLTENMVINSLDSDETTLPLSAAQGKHLGRLLNISIQHRSVGRIIDNSEIEEILGITAFELGNYKGPESGRLVVVEQSSLNIPGASYERVFYSVRYQSDSHSFNWTFIPITNTLNTYKKCFVSILRSSSGQFSFLDINEGSTTDLQNLDKAIGQPYINTVDLRTPSEVGYFWNVNGTKTASSPWNISDSIALNKGDLLIVNDVSGSAVTSVITAVSNTGDFIDSLVAADGTVKGSYSYIADKDCKVQLSYGSNTSAYIVKSSQNAAIADITTSTAALHKVYESYGAVYNKETGYWEYGDLKDMTEEDCFLAAFYALEQIQGENQVSFIFDRFRNIQARTYFTKICPKSGYNATKLCLNSCFAQNIKLEYLKLSTDSTSLYLYINNILNAFRGCVKLRKIEDVLGIFSVVNMTDAFIECHALRDVKIRLMSGTNTGVSFRDSPLLSYESLNYLVTNAANTAAITVTVHPTTYSYLTGTAQPTEEVGGTTEEWQALVTTAQGKKISFAQPSETLEVESLE